MMTMQRLDQYLKNAHIHFKIHKHPAAYTALEVAEQAHVEGKRLAKTVIAWLDGELAMVVMPATHAIDLLELPKAIGCKHFELAMEEEFAYLFNDCEPGAMPPMGNLFDMQVYLDDELAQNQTICFCGGEHNEVIEMAYQDFERTVHPHHLHKGFVAMGQNQRHQQPPRGRIRH
jgi:Ala-tRNA(Pro) deacylase